MYQFTTPELSKVCDDGQDKKIWSELGVKVIAFLSPPTPQLSYVWRNGTMSTNGLVTKYSANYNQKVGQAFSEMQFGHV